MPFFGITFYPDQWPEEYWEEALAKIKETGLSVVRFGEMMWDWVEPRENEFQFKKLDKALDLCHKHGLKVILGTAIAQAPQWLMHKYPQLRPIDSEGILHPEYGPRPNACRDNPIFKKYAGRLVEKMAKRYGHHPALFMWQLDNEPSYPPLDLSASKDFCHCTATRQAFIAWAKNKYKTLEALNAAWGTKFWVETFSDFDEIATPKVGFWDAGNPHIYLDWFRFKSEQISTYLKWLKSIVRKHDKTHKIGTNSFTTIPNRAVDHDVMAEDMDWFGWDIYPKGTGNSDESLAQIANYWRSVCQARGAAFIVAELQAGTNVRWGHPGEVKPEDLKRWAKILLDCGAEGILFFNWRTPLFGSENGGFGLLNSDGTPNAKFQAVKEIINEYKNAGELLVGSRLETAIYYSKSSEIETYQEEGPPRAAPPGWFSGRGNIGMLYAMDSIAGAHRISYPQPVDFIFDRGVETGKLPYKKIFLTNPYLLSEKQFDQIQHWVHTGGTLITEARFGLKNENGHLYPRPLIEGLLQVSYQATEIIEGELKIPSLTAVACGFRDIVKCNEPVASFEDGNPAIIEKKIGKGKVVYATFSLFPSLLRWENGKLLEFVRSC